MPRRTCIALALALVSLLGLGCVAESSGLTATPESTEEPVFRPVTVASETATPPPPLSADEIDETLQRLVCWYADPSLARTCLPPGEDFLVAMEQVAQSADQRFVAPLVDMMWLDLGWERWVREALEQLTGERWATPSEWYAWVQEEQPPLPETYAEWKRRLLAVIDPQFAALIPDERVDGGPGPADLVWALSGADAMPPLVAPTTVHRVEQLYLDPGDVVFGVVIGGTARAYPQRILGWHGVLSDEVGGVGILVWNCVVCGSAAVFDRIASDGVAYTFSASGFMWGSRRLISDAETGSLSAESPDGPSRAASPESGVSLRVRPSLRTTWGEWEARYANSSVLSLDTGYVRDYSEGAANSLDGDLETFIFPLGEVDDRLPPKTRILGVTVNGARKAYPLDTIESRGLTFDAVGGVSVMIYSAGPGQGATVYATDGASFLYFSGPPDDRTATDGDELFWFVDDERLLNARNSRIRYAQPAQTSYWFAWAEAFPETGLWEP